MSSTSPVAALGGLALVALALTGCGTASPATTPSTSQPATSAPAPGSPSATATNSSDVEAALPSGQGSSGGNTAGGKATGSASASRSTEAATPVSRANLPTGQDLVFGDQVFTPGETYQGDGQAPVAACQTMGWESFKPNTIWTREYADAQGNMTGGASIASFASHAQAVAAMEKMGAGLTGCGKRMTTQNPDLLTNFTEKATPLTFPGGRTARTVTLNLTDGETGTKFAVSTGVVATGTHVAIISIRSIDNPPATADSRAIEDTLARSLVRLA
ncbi:hypothetical protein [Luteococcus peritonei]|uniref:PknH-like extracellular domain-containing protein n=1 Tax=Luteococcus peritonei TaxID=88874 RepID=A0ABW4RZF2_9ACTN